MKNITREVKVYTYVFANIDLETGSAYNKQTVERAEPMGQREINAYQKDNNNVVLIHKSDETRRFSCPLTEFVSLCEDYARRVNEGVAEPISDADDSE